jgi:pullulanase
MGNVLPEDQRAAQINAADMPNIAHFNDYIRDGLKGSVFGQSEAGWVNGNYSRRSDAVGGVVGGITKFTTQPVQSVNYVEAHDNNTLWDKLQFTNPQDSTATRLKMDKIAATFIFTAQGIPFMQAGQEFLRTKGGDSNSYKSPDSVNQLDWKRKAANINTVNYYKGLIQLRKAHPAFRMTTGGQIRSNLKFISTGETVIAYTINNKANGDSWKTIVVAHNADRASKTVKLPSSGTWKIVVNGTAAGTKVIKSFKGSSIKVPALTSMVLYKN